MDARLFVVVSDCFTTISISNVATFSQLQDRVLTHFGPDGQDRRRAAPSTLRADGHKVSHATQCQLEYRGGSRVVKELLCAGLAASKGRDNASLS